MLKSQIFDIPISKNLTKQQIENFIKQKGFDVVKWSIVEKSDNLIKILISFDVNL